jgi:hypothetical protein
LFKYRSFSAFFSNFAAENKKSVLLNKVLRGMTVSLNHLGDLARKRRLLELEAEKKQHKKLIFK